MRSILFGLALSLASCAGTPTASVHECSMNSVADDKAAAKAFGGYEEHVLSPSEIARLKTLFHDQTGNDMPDFGGEVYAEVTRKGAVVNLGAVDGCVAAYFTVPIDLWRDNVVGRGA